MVGTAVITEVLQERLLDASNGKFRSYRSNRSDADGDSISRSKRLAEIRSHLGQFLAAASGTAQ